jgi:hypothetical protein
MGASGYIGQQATDTQQRLLLCDNDTVVYGSSNNMVACEHNDMR